MQKQNQKLEAGLLQSHDMNPPVKSEGKSDKVNQALGIKGFVL